MDQRRFDKLTRTFATGLSRRSALRRLAGGGLAALGATGAHKAAAQDATPPDSPGDSGSQQGEKTFYLFIQTFGGGTWAPKADEDGVYTLTLTESTEQTIYFSDRPERVVGMLPTQQFLDELGFSPENPPNAALVAQTEQGEDVLVIELFNPQYNVGAGTLTYDAIVLENYQQEGLRFAADRQGNPTMPDSFGAASLFIDDCPIGGGDCFYVTVTDNGYFAQQSTTTVGQITWDCCWDATYGSCSRCGPQGDAQMCADAYPVCRSQNCQIEFYAVSGCAQ